MKKNLRIVSAAAAALLAVAPVAATAVVSNGSIVKAADATNSTQDFSHINLGGTTIKDNYVANVNPSFTLNGALTKNGALTNLSDVSKVVQNGNLTGSISANAAGVTATANLIKGEHGAANVRVTAVSDGTVVYDGTGSGAPVQNFNKVIAGQQYKIEVKSVGFNFGANNAGKEITLALPKSSNIEFSVAPAGWTIANSGKTIKGHLDNNGTVNGLQITQTVTAFNPENNNDVTFYDVENGTRVTSGNVMVLADYNGQLNVSSIEQAILSKYTAMQRKEFHNNNVQDGAQNILDFASLGNGNDLKLDTQENDITKQLESAGIKVSPAGYFKAPHSFKATIKVSSNINGKSAELPVTFNVANVAVPTEPSVAKEVMHNAYYYNDKGVRVGTDKAATYSTVNFVADNGNLKEYTINGKKYYKVANENKYVAAGNVTGTKRTLKHNAYVYATSKKRVAAKTVLKKGESTTTYGAAVKLKNGKAYYRIGKTQYVKKANF